MTKIKIVAVICLFLISALICPAAADNVFERRLARISKSEMQGVMEFLGHDLLEGRAPGSRGGDLAEIYMRSLFKFMNLEPGWQGRYFQPFTLKKFVTENICLAAGEMNLKYRNDLVGTCTLEAKNFTVSGPVVFAGFGIRAEQWNWDDFKDADLSGKIIITRVNDPGLFIPDIFEGKTLTYYGRWTCHIEEAIRRGARGILLIHTNETAGYDWDVVKNSWTGGEFFIEKDIKNSLVFRGWIREKSLQKLLDRRGLSLKDLYKKSLSRNFHPVDLGFSVKISGKNRWQDISNHNVVGHIPGQSPQRIVLSAHIDHLGKTDRPGDGIFNGAIDNGSAVAAMMVTAKILKEFQPSLYYSTTILACNSEEAGLLGSRFFVNSADRSAIIANINFESTPVWKPAVSLMGIGARFSTFADLIRQAARKDSLKVSRFSLAGQGLFFRSDQFSFARRGIPAVWISAGEEEIDGKRHYTEFWNGRYHTVEDEYNPAWDLGSMRQTIRAALRLIQQINAARTPPQWKNNCTFPQN